MTRRERFMGLSPVSEATGAIETLSQQARKPKAMLSHDRAAEEISRRRKNAT
jgi:hypothetical protein